MKDLRDQVGRHLKEDEFDTLDIVRLHLLDARIPVEVDQHVRYHVPRSPLPHVTTRFMFIALYFRRFPVYLSIYLYI